MLLHKATILVYMTGFRSRNGLGLNACVLCHLDKGANNSYTSSMLPHEPCSEVWIYKRLDRHVQRFVAILIAWIESKNRM